MFSNQYIKDPNATLNFRVDWAAKTNGTGKTDWLEPGDTIATSTWIVPAGLTQVATAVGATTATIWLSGGTAGSTYAVTNRITTSSSPALVQDQTIYIVVQDQ